ncbi:ATP-binding protein [Streptomyces sp. NPDC005096]|uniref:ATP-binding protein n=1 Tax=Streptomyces sp. NPDC005096 TaxID=3154559 RepID=UPI00339FC3B2
MSSDAREPFKPHHFLDTPNASIVATDTLLQIQDTIRDTVDDRAMSVIYGEAGLGKTFGTRAALQEIDPELLLSLEFARSRPGPKDLREELFHQMCLPGTMPGTPTAMDKLLRTSLPRRPYVIVCDEAQQYRRQCFEFVRNLWDTCASKETRPAVLFVGGHEAYDTLQSDPALASRIHIRQEILPLSEEGVLSVMPAFQPVWKDADASLLKYVDKQHGGGVFRKWANITKHVLVGMKRLKKEKLDREVVDWALARC